MALTRRQVNRRAPGTASSPVSKQTSILSSRVWLFCTTAIVMILIVVALYNWIDNDNDATTTTIPTDIDHSHANIFHSPADISASVLQRLDAIFILGGGKPISLQEPPVYVQRRCDDAAAVVQRRQELAGQEQRDSSHQHRGDAKDQLAILCLSAGTAHLPQLLAPDGLPIWEATSSAAYLQRHHGDLIDSRNVFVETTSYDTIGNAFYARVGHSDLTGWRNLLIVTNDFHIPRSKIIFDWIFSLPPTTDSSRTIYEGKPSWKRTRHANSYKLYYLSSPNAGLSDDAIDARKEKEMASIQSVHNLSKQYQTLPAVWSFLNREHALYTAHKLIERGSKTTTNSKDQHGGPHVDSLIKKSYGLTR